MKKTASVTHAPGLERNGYKNMSQPVFEGKVRSIHDAGKDRLLMVTTDRISAYDVIMPTMIPDKGKILNQLSIFWVFFDRKHCKESFCYGRYSEVSGAVFGR